MSRWFLLLFLVGTNWGVVGWGNELTITGSDLLTDALGRDLEAWASREGRRVQMRWPGSRPGWAQVRSAEAMLGLCFLPPGEVVPADGLVSRVIGVRAVFVVVAETSVRRDVTVEQLREVFGENQSLRGTAGRATTSMVPGGARWSTGLVAGRITEPTAELFARQVLAGENYGPTVEWLPSDAEVCERLRTDPDAVGLISSRPAAESGLRTLAVARKDDLAGVGPTPENLQAGRYPLHLPLMAVFRRQDGPRLQALLRHLLLDESAGAALAAVGVQRVPIEYGNRLLLEWEGLH